MSIRKLTGALALGFIVAAPAAYAAPIPPAAPAAVNAEATLVHEVGYRHGKYRKFNGGISYVGDYGLKYAPTYHHRHWHNDNVSVKVYIGPQATKDDRQRARPLIIDLPN